LKLKLLGEHNLSNALAAVVVGRQLGLDFEAIALGIATFEGARRRFERRGEINQICFVDDYAHHPSEIRATLAAARLQIVGSDFNLPIFPDSPPLAKVNGQHPQSNSRIVAIFQPHRYSRTLTFLAEFAQSFKDADIVVVSDIYSAGEPNLGQVSGQQVAELIGTHQPNVYYQPSLQSICRLLTEILQPGDFALFLGAGDMNQIIPEVMAFYQKEELGIGD
jgi:UDP-N-acetylmuramate--alanine ligase